MYRRTLSVNLPQTSTLQGGCTGQVAAAQPQLTSTPSGPIKQIKPMTSFSVHLRNPNWKRCCLGNPWNTPHKEYSCPQTGGRIELWYEDTAELYISVNEKSQTAYVMPNPNITQSPHVTHTALPGKRPKPMHMTKHYCS